MAAYMERKPAVAGQFYPNEPGKLRAMVEGFIEESGVAPAPDSVAAIIAPHAGFIYSGPTAGFAYARIRGKRPRRVILAGCSHREYISTASVFTRGAFLSPLGAFPIDEAFAEALARETQSESESAHLYEHALEVQLPFLAAALGEVPIVPVLLGSMIGEWHARLGRALAKMSDPSDLLIASTDLSHYLREPDANSMDQRTLEAVLAQKWDDFAHGIQHNEYSMCGAAAVSVAMAYAQSMGANAWNLLDYRTSGRVSGDYERVVGYAAISMEYADEA